MGTTLVSLSVYGMDDSYEDATQANAHEDHPQGLHVPTMAPASHRRVPFLPCTPPPLPNIPHGRCS